MAFTGVATTGKSGFAATGLTSSDFWNTYDNAYPAAPNLEYVDGTPSGSGLTVANAAGVWGNGTSDPMYSTFIYPSSSGSITVTVTNLASGTYDFYLYGHGGADNGYSIFQVSVGSVSYGSEATVNGPGWDTVVWQEGMQYVEFTNVVVPAGQTVTILAGPNPYDVISGLQMALVTPTNAPAAIVAQPANQTLLQGSEATFIVGAGGTAPLAYQWLFDGTAIASGTNSSYSVTNSQATNAGSYTVVVTNLYGGATSAVATLNVTTSSGMLIDIALGVAGSTAKVGFAAIGQTSADFWNYASSPTPTAP